MTSLAYSSWLGSYAPSAWASLLGRSAEVSAKGFVEARSGAGPSDGVLKDQMAVSINGGVYFRRGLGLL